MSNFSRFIKIFIFMLVIFLYVNISSCGNKPDDPAKSAATIDPDLVYQEALPETDPTTEIISNTIPFSQDKTLEITQETTKSPETVATVEITEKTEEINETEETIPEDLYVITPSGKKYHYPTCRTVKSIKQYLSKEEAEKLGYEPCKICNPK